MPTDLTERVRAAGIQLSALRSGGALPAETYENAQIESTGTEVYDLNGELLFHRVPIRRGTQQVAFTDVAAHEGLGGPLLATSSGLEWNEAAILDRARAAAAKRKRNLKYDTVRFVAYSYPKIALQFLQGDTEVLMLEWMTWEPVPPARPAVRGVPPVPGNFERWSLLDSLPAARKRANARSLQKSLEVARSREVRAAATAVISTSVLTPAVIKLTETYEVHFRKNAGHVPCFELRGQETNVWCVAASTQMLLNFYRFDYTQTRLAQEMGLGTLAHPNGLPYGQEAKVVTCIEKLSSNVLDATVYATPTWALLTGELYANRPLISFIPGHSRAVAGFTRSLLSLAGSTPFRGLLVYDPWPPTTGVITRWENFNTSTYRNLFTAVLKHV